MGIKLKNGTNHLIELLDKGQKPYIKIQKEFKYICEESIDPGFIVQIISHHIDQYGTVKFYFKIPHELLSINKEVATNDWLDHNGVYSLDWFEKHHAQHNWTDGPIKDYFYVEKHDQGWFKLFSDKDIKGIMKKNDAPFLQFIEENYPQFFSVLWNEFIQNKINHGK